LKNSAQIYGQQFSMGIVITIEPSAGALSVEEAVMLFCTVFKRLVTLKTVEEFAADSLTHELTA